MQGRSDRLPAAAAQPTSAPRTGRRVGCAAALLAASFLMAALSSGARADQVITNGGFETGTLAGWNAGIRPDRANGGLPYLFNTPSGWLVSNQTQTDGTLSLAPINGSSAFNGFEGSPAGLQFFLNQGFTFNSVLHDALLSFTFDIVGGPQAKGALGRRFEVWITSMSGHDRAKLFSYTITETDANPKQKVSMNIRSALNTLGPSAYMLEFREVIPEGNSGPALFVLDDVSLDLTQNSCPKVTCPPSQTLECTGPLTLVHLHGSANDADGDEVTFTWREGNTFLGSGQDLTVGLTPGTHVITLMTSDMFGAMGMCDFTITIVDTKPPVLVCPADRMVGNDTGKCFATLNPGTATAVDDCDGPITPICVRSDNKPLTDPFPIGTTTIKCTATDHLGHKSECTQTIVVKDTEKPKITCSPSFTVVNDVGDCTARVLYEQPTVTDNCPGVTFTCVPPLLTPLPVGPNTITCTATDAAGNTASCSFTVTVRDADLPTIQCPADIVTTPTPGVCGAIVNYTATAMDNCPGVTLNCVPPSGSLFPLGMTTVTCTATDKAGNTKSCSFKVTVTGVNSGEVSIQCPGDIYKSVSELTKGDFFTFTVTATPGTTVVCKDENGNVVHSGDFFSIPPGLRSFAHTITCTATDACGHTATCTFKIHLFC